VNARPHHQSRLSYFRKTDRGRYELLPEYRLPKRRASQVPRAVKPIDDQGDTIHAVITKHANTYVVDCHEVAVVTQGSTIDEALANLIEAVTLHLEGEELATLGLGALKRIHVSYELPANVSAA
jgi:predicted RNase H-like HicB family nuclease